MKTVFLTGATGFIGSHTAKRFIRDGWQVKALVRRPDRPGLLPGGVQIVVGDLASANTYENELKGCDAIVHIAGLTRARSFEEYRQANSRGAEAISTSAARVCRSAMFVLVSSQAAAGPAVNGRAVREEDVPQPVSWYGRSKLEGEQAVAEIWPGPWCAVRPCVIYGPGDQGMLSIFQLVARGIAPILAGGNRRVQLLAVEDLAEILYRSANRPDLSGRRGFAAGESVTMRELVMEIAALRDRGAWRVPVPAWAIRIAGGCETLRSWVTRRSLPFSYDKAREMLQPDWLCDSQPFLQSLGVSRLKPWKEGIRDTCKWYVEQELLPNRFTFG